jgi:hypothetical protein
MTETFLNKKKQLVDKALQSNDPVKAQQQEEYSHKMIQIMKEMQSPKKFNSPMQRRNQFGQLLPIPIRKGDTII